MVGYRLGRVAREFEGGSRNTSRSMGIIGVDFARRRSGVCSSESRRGGFRWSEQTIGMARRRRQTCVSSYGEQELDRW